MQDYPLFGLVIITFIFFTNMLLLNLITGVIVENTLQIARCDEEEALRHLDEMKFHCLRDLQELMLASDVNGDGLLDRSELEDLLNLTSSNEREAEGTLLHRLHIDLHESQSCAILKWFPASELLEIFDLVDAASHGGGAISMYLFIDAISRSIGVRGGITRAQDLVMGQYELMNAASHQQHQLRVQLRGLTSAMPMLLSKQSRALMVAVDDTMGQVVEGSKHALDRGSTELDRALNRLRGLMEEQFASPPPLPAPEPSRTPERTPSAAMVADEGPPELTGAPRMPYGEKQAQQQQQGRQRIPLLPNPQACMERAAALEEEVDRACPGVLGLVRSLRNEVCYSAELLRRQAVARAERGGACGDYSGSELGQQWRARSASPAVLRAS